MISKKTAKEIVEIIRNWTADKCMAQEQLDELLESLTKVKGNKSFTESLTLLRRLLKRV